MMFEKIVKWFANGKYYSIFKYTQQEVADNVVHGDVSKVKVFSVIPSYGIKFSKN